MATRVHASGKQQRKIITFCVQSTLQVPRPTVDFIEDMRSVQTRNAGQGDRQPCFMHTVTSPYS